MRNVLIASVLIATSAAAASATVPHPYDTSATLIDSFVVSTEVPLGAAANAAFDFDLGVSASLEVEETVCVWSTSNGIDITGDVATIRADAPGVDDVTLSGVIDALAAAAVDTALARDYLGLPDSSGGHITVYHARCVIRSGSGVETRFTAVSEGFAGRLFMLSGSTNWYVVPVGSVGCEMGCPTGTERTCE